MNPEKLIPIILATPVLFPMDAISPIVSNSNGFFLPPRMEAIMFFASTLPCRIACCAVGGYGFPVRGFGIDAQSPSAQTSGHSGSARNSFTDTFPCSFGQGREARRGLGATPAVQMSVED